jgi:hypothetical protein
VGPLAVSSSHVTHNKYAVDSTTAVGQSEIADVFIERFRPSAVEVQPCVVHSEYPGQGLAFATVSTNFCFTVPALFVAVRVMWYLPCSGSVAVRVA